MSTVTIDLSKLVSPQVDSISGRAFGEEFAVKQSLLEHVKKHDKIVVKIDPKQVRMINDSFIKGFFSQVFAFLKSKKNVQEHFTIEASDSYKRLFEKNWSILEAINTNAV